MGLKKKIAGLAAWFICLIFSMSPGVALAQEQAHAKALQVGILPMSTTRVLIKNYQPLRAHLERELNRPVELVTAPDFRSFHFNTIAGKYDLIVTAAHLGRLAETAADYVPLARYKAPNQTLLIVARDQPLKSIQDLRGKVLAGIDPITLAMNAAVLWLKKQGLRPDIDFTVLDTPTPISAIYSLNKHQSAVAVSSAQGLKQLPEELRENIEILVALPELPSLMWLAHPRMKSEAARLKKTLLGFTPQSKEGAMFYETTGYMGMRELTPGETRAMDALAEEVNALLNRKK